MTARVRRRKKRTVLAVVLGAILVVGAATVVAVGAMTLLDSEEGQAVEVDDRPVVALPETPNALLAVSDDKGRLTSVVVATLDPERVGGNIVTMPVNADANAGFEAEPMPLHKLFDPDDPEGLREAVEAMLAITIERVDVVSDVALTELLDPFSVLEVDLPEDVIDSDAAGSGVLARAGEQTLRRARVVDALTASDKAGKRYSHHDVDVEIWSKLAGEAPTLQPRDDLEVPPETVADLFADLWAGPVDVRDLALSVVVADPGGPKVDSVIIDRRDSLLVFTQISPGLVSKPNEALSFRVVARFNDEQIEASEGLFISNEELTRRVLGELLFYQANVVSVDTSPAVEGAPAETRAEVADVQFIDDLEALAEPAFGGAEVVEATTLIEGVDVVLILGTDYIEHKVEVESAPGGELDESDPTASDTVDADE